MAQPEDIVSLLERLQYGGDREDLPSSFIQKPPGQDPRVQAIQHYMQMQGAQQPPQMGAPREMAYPSSAGKTKRMSRDSQDEMRGEMQFSDSTPDEESANMYFQKGINHNNPDVNQELEGEGMRQDMRRPSYVDSKGRPSPDENYNDDDLLSQLAARLNR